MEPNSVPQNSVVDQEAERIREDLLRPLFQTTWRFYTGVSVLVAIGLAGMAAFIYQTYSGMGVAGISRPVFWAFYITNFVFWIGISHAGTLISAILRLVNATWRRPDSLRRGDHSVRLDHWRPVSDYPLGPPMVVFLADSIS